MSERELASAMRDVLEGVAYLHASGVVHRDLKLKNILVDRKQAPFCAKIADFGLSYYTDRGEFELTSQVGSPHYVAPEVLGDGNYGTAVDMWSCGVISYALSPESTRLRGRKCRTRSRR